MTGFVYVTQEPRTVYGKPIDLTPAMDFGVIVYLLPKDANVLDAAFTTLAIARKMRSFGDNDYILPVGDPAAIGIASAMAARLGGGKFNMLKWDRQEKKYYPISINLNRNQL